MAGMSAGTSAASGQLCCTQARIGGSAGSSPVIELPTNFMSGPILRMIELPRCDPARGSEVYVTFKSLGHLVVLSAMAAVAGYGLHGCGGGAGLGEAGPPGDDGGGLPPGQGGSTFPGAGGVVAGTGGQVGPLGGAGGQATGAGGSTVIACGEPGTPCCGNTGCNNGGCCVSGICMAAGGTCVNLGGGVCNAGSCGTCGAAGQLCCTSSTGAGVCTAVETRCGAGGICTKCGDPGGACCPGPTGGTGTCKGASICSNDLCIACGTPGTACCPGNQCASGCCYSNTCLGEGTACGSNGGTCQAGRCSGCGSATQGCCANLCYDGLLCKSGTCTSCGGVGQTCCASGGATPVCQAGTICSGDVCARCGGLGDICCDGNACNEGCCSAGRCLAAGSCSPPDASIETDAPLGGAGGAGGTGGSVGSGGAVATGGVPGTGGITSSGGIVGTGGTSTSPGPCGDLVDDMEAGTGWSCEGNNRKGFWFTYVDSYDSKSTIIPAPNQVAKPELMSTPRDTSTRAMHASGTFTDYVGMGVLFNIAAEGATPKTYDASAYTGIKFWAKGSGSYLSVLGQTDATETVENGGTCTKTSCIGNSVLFTSLSSSWKQFTVPFSYLTGGTAIFEPASLWSIEFAPYCGSYDCSFDFWIDDITLYK